MNKEKYERAIKRAEAVSSRTGKPHLFCAPGWGGWLWRPIGVGCKERVVGWCLARDSLEDRS